LGEGGLRNLPQPGDQIERSLVFRKIAKKSSRPLASRGKLGDTTRASAPQAESLVDHFIPARWPGVALFR
jgi:hypothetical protein